jgi:hypothetical protein
LRPILIEAVGRDGKILSVLEVYIIEAVARGGVILSVLDAYIRGSGKGRKDFIRSS